jgi:hypothetical protein
VGNILRALAYQIPEWGIYSGPWPIKYRSGEYTQGLGLSNTGVGNILRALANQIPEWGIYSGPWPIKYRSGEYTQGLGLSNTGVGNILRALANQIPEWGIYSGPWPIKYRSGEYTQGPGLSNTGVGNIDLRKHVYDYEIIGLTHFPTVCALRLHIRRSQIGELAAEKFLPKLVALRCELQLFTCTGEGR